MRSPRYQLLVEWSMLVCSTCGATYRGSIRRCPFDGGALVPGSDPLLGTSIGPYRVVAPLGQGAFAVVYRAVREDPGDANRREVAVKVLAPELARSPTVRERFAREARAVARLRHPGIVEILDVWLAESPEEGAIAALVMPSYDGETLKSRLLREATLAPGDARRLARELAVALSVAHAGGVVHRDVKPSNVIVRADGSAVLIDFGLARLQGEAGLTETGDLIGSPAYMAPEQVRGEPPTAAVDHYALGCLWFEMVMGKTPFSGSAAEVLDAHLEREPPVLTGAGVSAEERALARELLAKDPARRTEAARRLAAGGLGQGTS